MAILDTDPTHGFIRGACPPVVVCPTNLLKTAVSAIAVGKKTVVSNNATPDIITGGVWSGTTSVASGSVLGSSDVLLAQSLAISPVIVCSAFSGWVNLDPYWDRFEVGAPSNNIIITSGRFYYSGGYASISLPLSTWMYIMVTQAGTLVTLYVNGGWRAQVTLQAGAIKTGYVTGGSRIKDLLFFTTTPSLDVPTTLAGFA